MSDAALAQLDAHIARVRRLPGLALRAAPKAAQAVEAEIERTIAAGTTSDGKAWAPKKVGSGKPLAGAAKALAVVAIGTKVYVRLRGVEARHHLGRAKGGVEREIIPTKGIPPKMGKAIADVLAAEFDSTMGGRK
jgi:hypothetical protein